MVVKVTFWQELPLQFSNQNYIIISGDFDLGLFSDSWLILFYFP